MDCEIPSTTSWRRRILGLSGLFAMILGAYLYMFGNNDGSIEVVRASSIKAGFVLLAAWLALPQLDRLPGWVFSSLIAGLLMLAIRPRIIAVLLRYSTVLIPLFSAIWLLRRLAPNLTRPRSPKRFE